MSLDVFSRMRLTVVSISNALLRPVVGLLLCMPKYVDGAMLLGEVTRAAATFVVVQGACNWFTDNYARLAECARFRQPRRFCWRWIGLIHPPDARSSAAGNGMAGAGDRALNDFGRDRQAGQWWARQGSNL
jgi:hypothetical protein